MFEQKNKNKKKNQEKKKGTCWSPCHYTNNTEHPDIYPNNEFTSRSKIMGTSSNKHVVKKYSSQLTWTIEYDKAQLH